MEIERRYCGPATSANGGYACGVVAALVDGDAEVTLRAPPPLDRPLTLARTDGGAELRDGDQLIATAVPTTLALAPPPPVSFAEAERAAERYPWRQGGDHPYPRCFVCGPERGAGDGLRIFPGAVADRTVAAAPFVPDAALGDADGRVRREIVWATLDCPSWFGFHCFHEWREGAILLGRLAARIVDRPRLGERCVAQGWFIERDGRKIHCGSALFSDGGALYAIARATWIVLKG